MQEGLDAIKSSCFHHMMTVQYKYNLGSMCHAIYMSEKPMKTSFLVRLDLEVDGLIMDIEDQILKEV